MLTHAPANSTNSARLSLEVEAELRCHRPRRYIMRAAEGGQEVVQRVVVRQVDKLHLRTPSIPVALEDIVVPNREVEEATVRDAWWVLIVILSSR